MAHGGVQRSAGAPNCSYFVNWKSVGDSMTWDIAVHTTGNYEVTILHTAAEAGATSAIQPGGSVRDEEVIKAANERGVAMVFTGARHFRH